VVERAGRPDPAERYPDAATMRAALADAARALPPPQPLSLAGLGGEIDGGPPTQIGRSSNLFDQDAPLAPPTVVDTATGTPAVKPRRRRRAPGAVRWISYAVIAAIVLALIGGGIAIAAVSTQAGTVAVPSVVGLTQSKATDDVSARGLSAQIVTRNADDPADTVIGQDPAPGAFVSDGESVTLVVSRGPPPVAIPNVSGQSPADAQAALEAQGFVVEVVRQYDETVPVDAVVGTDPAVGTKQPRDSTLKLLVSDGPAPVPVPDVAKMAYDQAAAQLSAAGFTPSRDDVFSDTVPKDQVIGTDPGAGQGANRGASIVVHVSKGPEMVTVPDLVGKSLEAAQATLQSGGFEVDTQSYLPGRLVRAQSPAAGTSVNKGTKVTLFF
jgi:eukaryotic-like serine/threonine-protein kinase